VVSEAYPDFRGRGGLMQGGTTHLDHLENRYLPIHPIGHKSMVFFFSPNNLVREIRCCGDHCSRAEVLRCQRQNNTFRGRCIKIVYIKRPGVGSFTNICDVGVSLELWCNEHCDYEFGDSCEIRYIILPAIFKKECCNKWGKCL
jgi:hypothetical protein